MTARLIVENFRGIKHGEIELAPLTILIGPNNSGKSTILEALFLLPNPLRDVPYRGVPYEGEVTEVTPISLLERMHRTLSAKGYAFLFSNYDYTNAKALIRYDEGADPYLLELVYSSSWQTSIYGSIIGVPPEPGIVLLTNRPVQGAMSIPKGNAFAYGALDPLGMRPPHIITKSTIMGSSLFLSSRLIPYAVQYLQSNWVKIVNSGLAKKVATEASSLSYEKYYDFTIEPYLGNTLAFYAYLSDGRRIRLGDMGDGIQIFAISRMLYEIVKIDCKFILWDDIEAHFNPRILHRVGEWIADLLNEGRQVVVSTHSLEAARILARLNERNARVYVTLLEDGQLKTRSLTVKDVEELGEAGVDPRVAEKLLL